MANEYNIGKQVNAQNPASQGDMKIQNSFEVSFNFFFFFPFCFTILISMHIRHICGRDLNPSHNDAVLSVYLYL